MSTFTARFALALILLVPLFRSPAASAQVVITEIMYHPVEEPAFNPDGSPVLDLYEDVHEFVELHNPGTLPVSMSGWELTGGIRYSFPPNAVIEAGEFIVIAKQPARLVAVPAYQLGGITVLGPYEGQLSNRGDTLRLRDGAGTTLESVTYSAEFPWAISADALGAGEDWTGLRELDYQYRGRSLERVTLAHTANDPANWVASPLPGNPSPGRSSAIRQEVPKPVVTAFSVLQESDEASLIRNGEPVRVHGVFSSLAGLSNPRVEWFVDDIDVTGEAIQSSALNPEEPSGARFSTVLPGQPDRSVVRFRFVANRGTGDEVVSPRHDDPYRWHAYFVTPVRTSSRPIYDCFISANSLAVLGANISQNPRRVTSPDPPGTPRESWNATEPAVMVHEGVVYDIRMRHHGSRYNRNVNRYSLKWQFPRYRKFNGVTGIFETDKGNDFVVGHGLFRAAGLPVSDVRYVDLHLNQRPMMQRLEQGEFDGDMLDEYHRAQQALSPGSPLELTGELYKSVGTIDMGGEGPPYGRGDGRLLSKPPHWTDLQMYDWTFALQNHGWRGSFYWKQMIEAFWAARGDSPSRPNPNIPALRAFFTSHFDIDEMLTYIALENWCCPWDDTTQNHFFWQRRNGKWGMLPWDSDAWFGSGDNTPPSSSIFIGEVDDPNNNFRGPNFFKDAFIKAFRQELKERFFVLNNTFLHPDNLAAIGFGSIRNFAQQRFASVNQQCGFGSFQRPAKPAHLAPAAGVTALPPMSLSATAYSHSAAPSRPHASTTWEIRTVDGSYLEPLWKIASSSSLVSIPIPFDQLRFGESYFWRCTYHDADGHPSLPSDETSFDFGPASARQTLVGFDAATTWRYNQGGPDLAPAGWTSLDFDDSQWASGPPLFAKEEAALPAPVRTPLVLGQSTYYFRKRFAFPGPPQGATAQIEFVVDDGCVIYVNGTEFLRVRMPEGAVSHGTYSSQNVGDAAYEGPIDLPSSLLKSGDNVIAVEVHQSNASSSDVVFGLSLEATLPDGPGVVVLNEIAARNTGSVPHAGDTPDWVELYNSGNQTVDLAGYTLTDDVLAPGKFVFPPSTIIPARAYLTVWCDGNTNAPGLHTGFGLNDEGQTAALFGPGANGLAVLDYVTFGLQLADLSIGRVTDGSGSWALTSPTLGAPNQAQALAPASGLKINEWLASAESGDDWLELYNSADLPVAMAGLALTDDFNGPTMSPLADLSFIEPHGFWQFLADGNVENGANHVGFKLSAGGEVLGLYDLTTTAVIDSITFGPQSTGVSQGRLPDGSSTIASFATTASPGEANYLPLTQVVISELLANTDPPFEDAIELQNIGPASVDLSGWWLSDSPGEPRKFRIPSGTVLQPGQFVVFYENQFNPDPALPASFALNSARGDELLLSAVDPAGNLTGHRTTVDFGPTSPGMSFGRFPTSAGHDFTALTSTTFGMDAPVTLEQFRSGKGGSNSVARFARVVISEIMFQPPNLGTNDNRRDEFIELFNPTDAPVHLFAPGLSANTWRLRGAVDFEFPPSATLSPRGVAVVTGFDPATDLEARAGFEGVYGSVVPLFGPFRGKLDNSGDDVKLLEPGIPDETPGPELGFIPFILEDRVQYSSSAPWPAAADSPGPSLTRLDNTAYGNDPANWTAAQPSPGRVASVPAWHVEIVLAKGGLNIRGSGTSIGSVVLQSSPDLTTWVDAATRPGLSGSTEFTMPAEAGSSAQYYRLILKP